MNNVDINVIEELKKICKENEVPKIIIDGIEYYLISKNTNEKNAYSFIAGITNE